MKDTIEISKETAQALSEHSGLGEFQTTEIPERMAWAWFVIRIARDTEELFPKGKWATVQHIENQLNECAIPIAP